MKIYTKQGDSGETSVIGGGKVSKASLLITAIGELDELNATCGLAAAVCADIETHACLLRIQDALFMLGSEVASPDDRWQLKNPEQLIEGFEKWIDGKTEAMEPLTNFVLPGGSLEAATLHMARTVCRRVERTFVELAAHQAVRPEVLVFMNRLSDWLFCAARYANHRSGVPDVKWQGAERK